MKIEKCNKLVCSIQDKENYVVHIRALKQALKSFFKISMVKTIY